MASVLNGEDTSFDITGTTETVLIHKIFEYLVEERTTDTDENQPVQIHGINLPRVRPEKSFVKYKNLQINHSRINMHANKIARAMLRIIRENNMSHARNSDGDAVIAMCLSPSHVRVVITCAILKTGAAYVPLEMAASNERLEKIISDSKPLLLVTEIPLPDFEGCPIITLDELVERSKHLPYKNLSGRRTFKFDPMESIAAMIFTSGSTEQPKGVRLRHYNIVNRLLWEWNVFPYQDDESHLLQATGYTYIDSIIEVWGPILYGRNLVIVSREDKINPEVMIPLLESYGIKRIIMVPTLMKDILMYLNMETSGEDYTKRLPNLTEWVSYGEELFIATAKSFYKTFNPETHTLYSFYICPETTGDCLTIKLKPMEEFVLMKRIPIGKPFQNTAVYILGPSLELVPEGEPGQICISGYSVAAGYVALPDSGRFIKNPYSEKPGFDILFQTGDYGFIQDGIVHYLGRRDAQLKKRGNKIDLSIMKSIISEIPGVKTATVEFYKPGESNQALLAFYTSENNEDITSKIEEYLKDKLMEYKIPHIIKMESFPYLPYQKIDCQSLLKYYEDQQEENKIKALEKIDLSEVPEELIQPANALFKTLIDVIGEEVIDTIKLNTKFYEIGGTSINTIVTITTLHDYGYKISITKFVSACNLLEILQNMKKTDIEIDEGINFGEDSDKYTIHDLAEEDWEEITIALKTVYKANNIVDVYLETPLSDKDYSDFYEALKGIFFKDQLSFTLKDKEGHFKAVALAQDFTSKAIYEMSPQMEKVDEWSTTCIQKAFHLHNIELNNVPGEVVKFTLVCPKENLLPDENFEISLKLEAEFLKIANNKNFKYVLSLNTHPLVNSISNDIFGYEVILNEPLNAFINKAGERIFRKAPDDVVVQVAWKKL